jgi:predicted exporter
MRELVLKQQSGRTSRKLLAALWLVLVAIMGGVLVTQMRHGLPLSTDLLALLPQEERDPVLKTANEAISRALGRHVIVLVGHPERAKARAAAQTMADALAATDLVDVIGSQATASQFRQIGATYFPHRHGLLGAEDRELLETGRAQQIAGRALAQTYGFDFAGGDLLRNDPFLLFPRFLMGLPVMASRLTMDDGMLSVTEGGVTWVGIIGALRQEPYRLDVQSALVGAVDRVEQTTMAEDSRVRILRTGTVFFAEAGSRTAMQEASNLSTLSMIGTVLLILLVFRRVGPLAQNTVTILVGAIVGVAATILIFGEIHAIALLFGTSLIGASVDYSLFYCATALDPEGGSPAQRLRRILPAVTLGLATTLVGYALLGLAPFPGLKQIAVLSAIGLFSAFLTVVAWLPLMDRPRPVTPGAERWLAFADGFYEIWEADRWRLARRALAGLVLAGAVIGVFRLNFDDDIRKLQALSRPLSAQQQQIFSLTGSSMASQYLLINAPDDETALQSEERLAPILARLKAEHVLGGVQTPAAYAPSASRQAADEALARERLTPLLSGHWRALGLDPGAEPAAPATGPLTLEQILKPGGPPFVKDLILKPGLHVGALQGLTQPQRLAEAIKGIPNVRFINPVEDFSALLGKYRVRALWLTILSFAAILAGLSLRYGVVGAGRIMFPPLVVIVATPLLLAALGQSLSLFHVVGLVLLLAISVDYAIFFGEMQGRRSPVTMFGVLIAASTAQLSFGLLILSGMPAMRHIGATMLLGITIAVLLAPLARRKSGDAVVSPPSPAARLERHDFTTVA